MTNTITPRQTILQYFKLDLTLQQIDSIQQQIKAQVEAEIATLPTDNTINPLLLEFINYRIPDYRYNRLSRLYSEQLRYDLSKYETKTESSRIRIDLLQKFLHIAYSIENTSTKTKWQFKIPKNNYRNEIDLEYSWLIEGLNIHNDIIATNYYQTGKCQIQCKTEHAYSLLRAIIDFRKEVVEYQRANKLMEVPTK